MATVRGLVSWALHLDRLVWLLPVAVLVVIQRVPPAQVERGVAVIVATLVILTVARAPARALVILAAVLPFHLILLSLLYRLGLPAAIIRPLGFWKEAVVVGIVVAGARAFRQRHGSLDALDRLALGYIAIVTAYLLFPNLFVGSGPTGVPAAPQALNIRMLAYRVDVIFVALFLGARHARLTDVRPQLTKAVLGAGVALSLVGVYEFCFSSSWNRFVVDTLQVTRYQAEILGFVVERGNVLNHSVLAGREFVRAGSLLLDPVALGFYLVVPLALAVSLIIRQRGGFAVYASTLAIIAALMLTFTRSALLSGMLAVAVVIRAGRERPTRGRARAALFLAGAVALALPLAAETGLARRTVSETEGSNASHLESLRLGLEAVENQPLGRGLGTAPGVGDRFNVAGKVTSENAYLQVGNEVGVVAMVLFVALVVVVTRRVGRLARTDPDQPFTTGLWGAGIGLMVGGLFLHVWLDFTLTWLFWGAAGLVVGRADSQQPEREPNVPAWG
jgi:hypothetical protein